MESGLGEQLAQAWTRRGLVTGHSDRRGVRQVLNDLNQRVRYAPGEYDEPPTPVPLSD